MENSPLENPNLRPEINTESENFDAKGNPRTKREMPDGTLVLLSDEEYKEELENQRN